MEKLPTAGIPQPRGQGGGCPRSPGRAPDWRTSGRMAVMSSVPESYSGKSQRNRQWGGIESRDGGCTQPGVNPTNEGTP